LGYLVSPHAPRTLSPMFIFFYLFCFLILYVVYRLRPNNFWCTRLAYRDYDVTSSFMPNSFIIWDSLTIFYYVVLYVCQVACVGSLRVLYVMSSLGCTLGHDINSSQCQNYTLCQHTKFLLNPKKMVSVYISSKGLVMAISI